MRADMKTQSLLFQDVKTLTNVLGIPLACSVILQLPGWGCVFRPALLRASITLLIL